MRVDCRFHLFLLFLALTFGAAGCLRSDSGPLDRETMAVIFADVLIVTGTRDALDEREAYVEKLDSVLAYRSVGRERFHDSLDHYRNDPRKWKGLMDHVMRELEKRRAQPEDR
jgi:hypothetical protein